MASPGAKSGGACEAAGDDAYRRGNAAVAWHDVQSRHGGHDRAHGIQVVSMAGRCARATGGEQEEGAAITYLDLLWRRAELQRRQQAMQSFRRTGTLSGEGPTRITFRRHAQHGLGAVVDVRAAPRRRWRRASAASRRRAQQRRVADGSAADHWGRWRIERVLRVERRDRGAAGRADGLKFDGQGSIQRRGNDGRIGGCRGATCRRQ